MVRVSRPGDLIVGWLDRIWIGFIDGGGGRKCEMLEGRVFMEEV